MRVVDEQGVEVSIGEPGEIQIRGHNVMKGYWNLPDATAAAINSDGWFASGDVGKVDEDGYFYIVDRKKSLIIRGGFNVYPREIEEVLYEHPAVAEAAVIGLPHDSLGEEIGAAVALKPGTYAEPSTRARSGSSTACPRDPPARSCPAKSPSRQTTNV
jgi:long-chain acyl-CoA synthetase